MKARVDVLHPAFSFESELRKVHPQLFRVFVRPHPDKYQGEVRLLDVGPD